METETKFVPPARSPINVGDIDAMGSHGFAYQAGDVRFTLIAPGPDGGLWTVTWSRGGASGFARARNARLAVREALASFDDLTLRVDAESALLMRKTEYVWRGPINAGRIAADWDLAIEGDAMRGFRCLGCLEQTTHPDDCPLHPKVLEEARARLLDLKPGDVTAEGLDLYVDYLRATAASR